MVERREDIMASVHASQAKGKGHNEEQTFYYINIIDIKTAEEQKLLFEKVKSIVELY